MAIIPGMAKLIPLQPPALNQFEGRDTIGTRVRITNAGDGLSESLAVEPEELSLGQKVHIVLEAECSRVHYERVPDSDAVRRVHTLKAGAATLVEYRLVKKVLDTQRIKIEQAAGVTRIGPTGEEPLDPADAIVLDDNGFAVE